MTSRANSFWCDVAAHPEGLAFAYATGFDIGNCRTIIVEVNGVKVLTTTAPSTPRYLRLAVSALGDICLVGQAQDGQGLLLYRQGQWEAPCPCYAVPGVRWDGVSTQAYTQISGTHYVIVTEGVVSDPIPIPIGLTSAGISQILSDGTPVWAQDARQRTIRGTTLLVTMEVEHAVVGQLGGIIGGIDTLAGDPFLALDAPGMDPRLAYSTLLQKYGCCSWTTHNVAYYNQSPPFLPVPPPDIVYPTVAPFTRRVRISPYKDLKGISGADSEVVIDGADSAAAGRQAWVGPGPNRDAGPILRAHANGTLLGIAAEGIDPDGLAWTRALANQLKTRIAWWSDGFNLIPAPTMLRSWDQVWQELYVFREHGETLAQAIVRWGQTRALLQASPCVVKGGIPQFFDRQLLSEQETVDIIAAGLTFINDSEGYNEVAPFEFDRTNGITGIASIRCMFNRALAASVMGIPVFPQPFPDPPPPAKQTSLIVLV